MIDERTGIDFPFFQSQVPDIFEVDDPRDQNFQAKFLRTMDFSLFRPHFDHVVDYENNPWNYKIYGNWIIEDMLRAAFLNVVDRGLAGELHSFDGCFNIRRAKGFDGWSMHSYGLPIDLNAAENPFGQKPSFSPEFVRCFADAGWEWGGLWEPASIRDGMHFQPCWIKVRTGPLAPVPWGGSQA
jgi:hypothetical protein